MFNSGFRGRRENDGQGSINPQAQYVQNKYPQPYISGWSISGSDDTSLNPAGGQTVLVNGSGFAIGVSATLGGVQIGSVTLVKPTQISFTAPANSGGSYTLIVYNSTGGAAILVPGLVYSAVPSWTTPAGSIGSYYETTAISSNVVATSDSALTYALTSGSLPSGATLYANGVITGTAPVDSGSTTYTFDITATDAELQDTTRTFTLTINVDVVTWVTPTNGTTYTVPSNVAISNVSLSATDAAGYGIVYSANSLPTGVSITGNVIYGTPTVGANTSTLLTATANTTGRTATNTINWVVQLGDSYWNLTTLALSANASIITSSFVTDASLNNAQITVVADTRPSAYNPYQIGYYSNYFDGTGDYITAASSSQFTLGTGDFTIEAWIYPRNSSGVQGVIGMDDSGGAGGLTFFYNLTAGKVTLNAYGGTAAASSSSITLNTWTHVAFARTSGSLKIFLNGTLDNTVSFTGNFTKTVFAVGRSYSGLNQEYFTGYVSNARVVKGYALYTATFTPSTTPLVPVTSTSILTCQSQLLIDTSPNNFAITKNGDTTAVPANPFATVYDYGTPYYSTYFDGTGDYLSVPTNTAFAFGTGSCTLEAWIYDSGTTAAYAQIVGASTYGVANEFLLSFNGSTRVLYGQFGTTGGGSSTGTITANTWTHVALVRNGSTVTFYINGVSSGSFTDADSVTSTITPTIGGASNANAASMFKGCISNLRVVKGQALYTANFTPSTTPLTTTSQGATAGNVSLLTCQSSTTIDNSTNAFAITSNGQAQPQPVSPFYSAYYSNYFDGTGDYLSIPDSTAFTIGTNNFTIEAWICPLATPSSNSIALIASQYIDTGSRAFMFAMYNNAGTMQLLFQPYSSSTATVISQNCTFTLGEWIHVAAVRSSNNITLYRNGVSLGTTAYSSSIDNASGAYLIGARFNASSVAELFFNGYISNHRFTNGQALYTSNFTPSTEPLSTTSQGATAGNVSLLTCQSLYFIDNSTNIFAITANGDSKVATLAPFTQPSRYGATTTVTTYGSGYFDGTGDYLTIPSSAALTIGTSSATVEFWIYPTSVTGYLRLLTSTTGGFNTGSFVIRFNNGTFLAGTGGTNVNSSTVPVLNAWSHIAWVGVSGTSQTLYINGVNVGTAASYNATEAIQYIGGYYTTGPAEYAYGYISNLRVVKGTALYTANFSPSLTPPTAVTNTQLLTLQTDGGSNDSQFVDASNFQNLVTRAGNATQGTFSPFSVTGWSGYFDGTGDYLSIPASTAFNIPTNTTPFTLECWVYLTSNSVYQYILSESYTGSGNPINLAANFYNGSSYDTTPGLYPVLAYYNGSSWTTAASSSTAITLNSWYHIAFVFTGSSTKIYINGTDTTNSGAATTWGGLLNSNGDAWYVGRRWDTGGSYGSYTQGYISNLRFVKGTAVYTSNFTPSTTPLVAVANTQLLTCQSPAFIDNSPNRQTITPAGDSKTQSFSPFGSVTVTPYYSNYFDGTGDYLTLPSSATLTMGTGDFTVECWVNPSSFATYNTFAGGSSAGALLVSIGTSGTRIFVNPYGSADTLSASYTFTAGVWYHIAICRSSTNLRAFINGSQVGTTAVDSTNYSGYSNVVGAISGGTQTFAGYISNLRITKGQALYTSNFTPSTEPLTTTSQGATAANVSLLTCQSSTFIDNSLNAFAITVNGNTIPTTIAPFASTATTQVSYSTSAVGGSMYFDGTGDYLTLPTTALISTTGNFTLETWVYPTSTNDGGIFYLLGNTQFSGVRIGYIGYFYLLHSSNGSAWAVNSGNTGTAPINQWYHIVVTRNTNAGTLYVNGVSVYTFTWSTLYSSTTNLIGAYQNTTYNCLTGYMSGTRITSGTAVYTAAFSPPTAPPTPTAATVLLLNGTNGGIIDYTGKNDLETAGDARVVQFSPYSGSYYSNYFDGGGDYLTTTLTGQSLGSGDFTIEFWMYQQINETHIFTYGTSWGDGTGVQMIYYSGSSNYAILVGNANNNYFGPILRDQWVHVAIVRSSGTVKVYFNGVASATTLSTTTNLTATALNIGYAGTGNWASYAGYISNFRMVSGTAIYTANFTPPTAPLTAVSGTRILTCQSSTLKDNSSNAFTITRAGDTAVKTQNPWQTNTGISYYFDGTGDYLVAPNNPGFTLGTGDFTIEAWIYPTSSSGAQGVMGLDDSGGAGGLTFFYNLTAGKVTLNAYGGTAAVSTASVSINAWTYVAFSRASGSLKIFLNGTLDNTVSFTGNFTKTACVVGRSYSTLNQEYFPGYISDLRITKYARYTSAFTPPTEPFLLN